MKYSEITAKPFVQFKKQSDNSIMPTCDIYYVTNMSLSNNVFTDKKLYYNIMTNLNATINIKSK